MHSGWLLVSLLPFGPAGCWSSCAFCAKRCFRREMPEACLATSAGGGSRPSFPSGDGGTSFQWMGSSVSAWGFPPWSGSWPDSLPGLGAILQEDTGALLGLEWQQTPSLATSPVIAGGETEARSGEVASCEPLLSGFLPRGVEAALLCLPSCPSYRPPISLSQFFPPLWFLGLCAADRSSPGLQWLV